MFVDINEPKEEDNIFKRRLLTERYTERIITMVVGYGDLSAEVELSDKGTYDEWRDAIQSALARQIEISRRLGRLP